MRSQFGTFEGRDNRKEVMLLFTRMGNQFGEHKAAILRAEFLKSLLPASENGFGKVPMKVTPCSAVDAYLTFIAITGCLGVEIEGAAKKLEAYIAKR